MVTQIAASFTSVALAWDASVTCLLSSKSKTYTYQSSTYRNNGATCGFEGAFRCHLKSETIVDECPPNRSFIRQSACAMILCVSVGTEILLRFTTPKVCSLTFLHYHLSSLLIQQ